MKKTQKILRLVLFAGILLAGCGQDAPTLVATEQNEATPTLLPQPSPTPDPEPAYQLGLQYFDDRAYEEAVAAFTEVLEKDPARALIYLDRALAYYLAGDMDKALDDIDRALELGVEPDTPAAYVKRGRCYSLRDEIALARADFDAAIDLDPEFAEAYVRRANLYTQEGRYDLALGDLEVSLTINPNYSLALTKQGTAYFYQGEDERAIAAFNRAIELDPEDFEAYFFRGSVKAVNGDFQGAIADFDRSIEIHPVNHDAYLRRANAYDDLGDFESALADYATTIELNPDNPETYYQRGIAYLNQAKYDLALADYDQAIQLDPEYAQAYVSRGRAYAILGLMENALADIDMAISLVPEYGYSHYLRGLLKLDAGDVAVAISELETARELGLDPDSAQYALNILTDINSEASSQNDLTGKWSGNTSQGDVIGFIIEEGQIVALQAGFSGPGCEILTPFRTTNVEYPISAGQFLVDDGGAVISGTFTSNISASGSLEFDCGEGINATWTAAKDVQASEMLSVDERARMPGMDIPVGLFSPESAGDNIDDGIHILGSAGDWFLVRTWVTDFPVPIGWAGTTYLNATVFSFGTERSDPDAAITQQIALDCQTKSEAREALLAQIEIDQTDPLVESPNIQVIDDDKAYLTMTTFSEGGEKKIKFIIASRNSHDCYSYMTFSVDEAGWDDYFPLIQAIVNSWYDNKGKSLGVSLPDNLAKK